MGENTSGIQVKDNRMFNPDGSLREGVSVEKSSPVKPAAAAAKTPQSETPPPPQAPKKDEEKSPHVPGYQNASESIDFPTFLLSLASSAQISLGLVPHPMSGQQEMDLDHARQTIDIIGMLEEKTRGNLTPEESGLMRQMLFQLRMQYVEIHKEMTKVK